MDPPTFPMPNQARSLLLADDVEMEDDKIEQQNGDEQGRPVSPINATSTRPKGGSRVTTVCAECKRLKLRCDRRTPCGKCVDRNVASKCIYDKGADGKIDIYTLHSRLVAAENTIEALVAFIGLQQEDYMEIKNAKGYPPRPDFKPRADLKNLRAALDLAEPNSSLAPPTYSGDKRRENLAAKRPRGDGQAVPEDGGAVLVAFANQKPGHPSYRPSTPSWVGVPSFDVHVARLQEVSSAPRPNPDVSPSTNVAVARSILTVASRVFSTTSTLASEEIAGHLELWANAFGWSSNVLHRSASVDPKADASSDDGRPSLAAPSSEGDYQDRPRPAGLLTLQFANQIFNYGAPVNSLPFIVVSPSLGSSIDTLGLAPPANTFSGSDAPSTPQVPNPLERLAVPPLVNPHDVISRLPPPPWRDTLWAEAEDLMVIHQSINSFARSGVLKRRVDSMFEWAELCITKERNQTQESDVISLLSGTTAASSRASGPRLKASRGPGPSRGTLAEEVQLTQPPTPPTMSFFAVASAAFALGALSYLCKYEHGLNGTMDSREKPNLPTTLPSDVLSSMASMDEPSMSVNFGSIAVMGILPSATTLAMTGNRRSGTVPSNPTPSKHTPDPTKEPLPDHLHPHVLHELSRAFILGHDALRLPHSLDYLHAHILGWVYMLHPPDSPPAPANANGGPCRGIAGGLVTSIDPMIWKEIGKCIAVAQSMNLDDLDCAKDLGGDEKIVGIPARMMPWEREMRRRVWWSITYFELFISACIGTFPSALTNSNSCKIPSDVDESRFDPKSTSLPPPDDPNFAMTHWVFKLHLVEIMSAFHRHSYINGKGVTPQALTDLHERLDNWKRSLPGRYRITVDKNDPNQTEFPDSQIVDVQACDLLIAHNRLIMKAWYPYFEAAVAHPTLPSNQDIISTCVDAAIDILVTSKHLLSRFRAARPIAFGYYGFGQPVWLSATLLASLAIAAPESPLIGLLGEGLSIAVKIVSDFVVCGKADGTMKQEHVVIVILSHLKTIFERLQAKSLSASSSKRKSADNSDRFAERNSSLALPTYSRDMRREELTMGGPNGGGQAVPEDGGAVLGALANQKPGNPSYRSPTPSWVGGPRLGIRIARRREVSSAARPKSDVSGSMNVAVAHSMLDMASRVFSTNSSLPSEGSAGHLKLWARDFGWAPGVSYSRSSVYGYPKFKAILCGYSNMGMKRNITFEFLEESRHNFEEHGHTWLWDFVPRRQLDRIYWGRPMSPKATSAHMALEEYLLKEDSDVVDDVKLIFDIVDVVSHLFGSGIHMLRTLYSSMYFDITRRTLIVGDFTALNGPKRAPILRGKLLVVFLQGWPETEMPEKEALLRLLHGAFRIIYGITSAYLLSCVRVQQDARRSDSILLWCKRVDRMMSNKGFSIDTPQPTSGRDCYQALVGLRAHVCEAISRSSLPLVLASKAHELVTRHHGFEEYPDASGWTALVLKLRQEVEEQLVIQPPITVLFHVPSDAAIAADRRLVTSPMLLHHDTVIRRIVGGTAPSGVLLVRNRLLRSNGWPSDLFEASVEGSRMAVKIIPLPSNDVVKWCNYYNGDVASRLDPSRALVCEARATEDLQLCLLTPWHSGVTLEQYLSLNEDLEPNHLILQLGAALHYLHCEIPGGPIKHSSINPDKVVVENGRVMLKDVGIVAALEAACPHADVGHVDRLRWMAPEIFNGDGYTLASDVYSLALVILFAISRRPPYPRSRSLATIILAQRTGGMPDLREFPQVSQHLADLLRRCWSFNGNERPQMPMLYLELSRIVEEHLHATSNLRSSEGLTGEIRLVSDKPA